IRHAEGRGSDSSEYYCGLPFSDCSGRNTAMWAMRARTYLYFERRILRRLESRERRPLDILDLGAGNCWFSYRVSLRRHRPLAVDIFPDERDGLRAARHYPTRFPAVEAEFDRLPFGSETFDIAVFNASLHYSTDYVRTLSEVRRCLRPNAKLIILDSPVYRSREDGIRMVKEKHLQFLRQYGFPSDAMPSIEFLDESMLKELAETLSIKWQIRRPWYGWHWHLRPLRALLRGRRRPSRFWILIGTFR
ncbi:MAG: class I SAM-dependent methyltransferase, partial [Bryobacteraceae bacterium]